MVFDETAAKKAIGEAEQFIKDNKITALPVDPVQIAKDLEIEVVAKPASSKGVSGMLLRHGDNYAIAYATHIDNEGFQRFSVAHELGHYLLPGHIDQLLPDGKNDTNRAAALFPVIPTNSKPTISPQASSCRILYFHRPCGKPAKASKLSRR
jgi:hypothetical protein